MTLELAQLSDLTAYQAKDPTLLLTAAQEIVRTYCRWHIAPERPDDVLTTTIPFISRLFLPTLHLTSVTSVVEDGTTLDPSQYEVNEPGWLDRIGLPTCLPWDTATSTVVTFTHGYETVPPDLQEVVLALADRLTDTPGVLSRVGQIVYAGQADAFTPAELNILRAYRIPPAT
jgi:hypothetical protein